MNNSGNIINVIIAILLSIGIMFGWQYFYEKPKISKIAKQQQQQKSQIKQVFTTFVDRNDVISTLDRVKISSDRISGSISLKGLRFDDLTLLKYKETLSEDSNDVALFSPSSTKDAYFAEIGWLSTEDVILPNSQTHWHADNTEITPDKPVNFRWTNPQGIEFIVTISIKGHYLFNIQQIIANNTDKQLTIQYYGLINRNYEYKEQLLTILHQGPIGTINDQLQERSYDKIKDNKLEKFAQGIVNWIGITDKYWLTAFIPDQSKVYNSNFNYVSQNSINKFQVDFISTKQIIESRSKGAINHMLFAGAKKVDLLDSYESNYNIKLFDRAIDFGWFYVLTKPLFNLMNFFYFYVGNFGLSILLVTVMIKLLMFSLANKSYRSMKQMKQLQPEIERIRTLYTNDKIKLNQEIMSLYKTKKINPISGCLPLLIQIPVFFSIYKVLYVTIEMRHAPFFGWIKDLSAPDPTSIFNLFGLLPFSPPSFLMIGAWPIFMAITMYLQQKMSPTPADQTQAMVMKMMPWVFLVMFSNFPAGLLIYWSWNNVLSIMQQYLINKRNA